MKLHRLVLTNYRGVTHREVEFPDHGVVVVSGANETGKSSMIEALDLLLESKDRSTKKDVKQVKPTNADVGAEVTAEISTGPYRFVYRKRFHKRAETELTLLAPRREQLTGDEAHERVLAMLGETVDTRLWHAQRVLQSASTAAVDLSECDALSRALDVAAGDDAALSGSEPLLIERIDAECARYFTPTGRPTGEWAAAISRRDDTAKAVADCAAAVAEVDARVRTHTELTERVAEVSQERVAAAPRLAAAKAAAGRIATLAEQAREAKLIAAAAAATSSASAAAHSGRQRLLADIVTRAGAVESTEVEERQAADAEATARRAAEAADAALEAAILALAVAQDRTESVRLVIDRLVGREEIDRLSARLARIDANEVDRQRVCAELSGIALDEKLLKRIESAAAAVDRINGQLAAISAAVEFTAIADIELVVGGQTVSLSAGQTWSLTATDSTAIELPGVLTARITPGAIALDVQAKYAAAQEELAAALEAGGVGDLSAARATEQRRRDLQGCRDQLAATLTGLCGDEEPEQLRAQLSLLRAAQPADQDGLATDAASARANLAMAEAARAGAHVECESRRATALAASSRFAESATQAMVLQQKLGTQRAELDAATERLTQERASAADDVLAAAAEAALRETHAAEANVAELDEQLSAAQPEAVDAELAAAAKLVDSLDHRYEETARALREISIELSVIGTEGRQGKLDAAEIECEQAASQHARVGSRARAAALLRETMGRHRDTTRLRYVEPYRSELQRLGAPVFGATFEVDIDSDLCVHSRTLDGTTVPFESLSGGAKEQLGILARLAGASLVAKEDAVPVVIDDALGFTDPDRLARMGEVFDTLGAEGQVIVLTCDPDRYDAVKGAHRIDLNV